MLTRYLFPDRYTTEELKQRYLSQDWPGRIRLLRRLGRLHTPQDVLEIALRDAHVQVRQWVARHGSLWTEDRRVLSRDPDPFVRACLWENPSTLRRLPSKHSDRLERPTLFLFRKLTPVARLALMRNPEVPRCLVERVFDPADTQLAIDLDEREQLVRASLTNKAFFGVQEKEAALRGNPEWDDYDPPDRSFSENLWEFASNWPPEHEVVREMVYRHVAADDETKAKWYKNSSWYLRRAILTNCADDAEETANDPSAYFDLLDRTLKEATMQDYEEGRQQALALAGHPELQRGSFTAVVRVVEEKLSLGFGNLPQASAYRRMSLRLKGTIVDFDFHGLHPETESSVNVEIEFTEDDKSTFGRWSQDKGTASCIGEVGMLCRHTVEPDKGDRLWFHARVELALPLTMRAYVPTGDGEPIRMNVQMVEQPAEPVNGDGIDEDEIGSQDTAPHEPSELVGNNNEVIALIRRVHFEVDAPKTPAVELPERDLPFAEIAYIFVALIFLKLFGTDGLIALGLVVVFVVWRVVTERTRRWNTGGRLRR